MLAFITSSPFSIWSALPVFYCRPSSYANSSKKSFLILVRGIKCSKDPKVLFTLLLVAVVVVHPFTRWCPTVYDPKDPMPGFPVLYHLLELA